MRFIPCLILWLLFQQVIAAEVNILVIGSTTDSSRVSPLVTVSPFDPTEVVNELRSILEGTSLDEVNVVFEDCYGGENGTLRHTNLFSWFHYPYPAEVAKAKRWPNLRGEGKVKWDYVVLIGDSHTIEKLPGFYALGVAEIAKEISKGTAKPVLMMPWPAGNSESTVNHYKEVVYRVARSGGYMVAPAGLTWQASGHETAGEHPTKSGAYLAAATLYSRIFGESASSSDYNYDKNLADLAHRTVQKNKGVKQYSDGRFASPHPHQLQFNSNRKVRYSFTGTSTERSHMERLREVMDRCRVEHTDHLSHRYDTNDPGKENKGWPKDVAIPIDFNIGKFGFSGYDEFNVNPDYWKRAYTFQYQGSLTSNEQAIAEIYRHDINAGIKAYRQAPHVGATIPRSTWAMLHRISPELPMNGHGNHLSKIAILPNASFIYTCESGRCPLTPQTEKPTAEWNALKVGYEAAWIMGNLQTRAPGFRVLPSVASKHEINNYFADGAEEMSVQFIFKPEASVIVNIVSSRPDLVKISPSTLTFTPENHDIAQSYTVAVAEGTAEIEEDVLIQVTTTSKDEVYHNLSDSWLYQVKSAALNSPPVVHNDGYRVGRNKTLTITTDSGLLVNDITRPQTSVSNVSIGKPVSHGELGLNKDGSFNYTPHKDFHGRDSFTYMVTNANGVSDAAEVTITVSDLDPGLILWYDFEEVNGTSVKDSTSYGRDGIMVKPAPKVDGVEDGQFGIDLSNGMIEIPVDQELNQLLDREISITFWSYINPVKKGRGTSVLLKGTKTHAGKTFGSLNIQFQTNVADGQSEILFGNGIYTQNGRVSSYSIQNKRKHSKERIPLTADVINNQWVHWTFMINRDTSFFSVFKNGTLAFKGSLAGLNAFGLIDEFDYLMLGPSFKGKIDDFRIYNRELAVKEMRRIILESAPQIAKKVLKSK